MTSEGLSGVSPELGDAIIHATEILNENSLDIEKTEKEFLDSKFSHLWGEVKKFLIPVKDDG